MVIHGAARGDDVDLAGCAGSGPLAGRAAEPTCARTGIDQKIAAPYGRGLSGASLALNQLKLGQMKVADAAETSADFSVRRLTLNAPWREHQGKPRASKEP